MSSSPKHSSSEDELEDYEYSQPLQGGSGLKKRVNSCWTIFVDSTVSKPNLESTLKCLSKFYARKIKENAQELSPNGKHDIFLDKSLPLKSYRDDGLPPQNDDIYNFLFPLFNAAGVTNFSIQKKMPNASPSSVLLFFSSMF